MSAQWDDGLEVHVRLGALAVRWHGASPDKWLQRVLESAKALLEGSKEHQSSYCNSRTDRNCSTKNEPK